MNNKVTKIFSLIAIYGVAVIGLMSCSKNDPNSPGVEYMPDMYRSPSLETNLFNVVENEDGTFDTIPSNLLPVEGTISRGNVPYALPNTYEGYKAAADLIMMLEKTDANMAEGKRLYGIYCSPCHGKNGEGDGKVGDKLPGPPPSYKTVLKDLPAGQIFHSVTYGKGLMGSHSSQLSQEERWQVVMYVQKLQGN